MNRPTFVAFASETLKLPLTRGQRVLCAVAIDGVEPADLVGADRALAREMFGDVDTIPPLARTLLVLILGRGSGKTTIAAAFALFVMLTADVSACGPGDVPTVVTIAPAKKTARLAIRMAIELVRRTPSIARYLKDQKVTTEGFSLRRKDGRLVAFEAFAASRGGHAARGISILAAILDESWFFQSDDGGAFVVNDRDVYRALVPRLMSGGKVLFISTPWPVETLTGELFERNHGNPQTALVARAPTLLMRDDASTRERVERERAIDPENASREFDCELGFLGSTAFFDRVAIEASIAPGPVGLPFSAHVRYAAGADLALVNDSSALVVMGIYSGIAEVAHLLERRPTRGTPLKLSAVASDFADALSHYHLPRLMADNHAREPAREYFQPRGIHIMPAPEGRDSKALTYLALRKAINESNVRLPEHARLLAQLRAITSKPMPGGGLAIVAPRRAGQGHCDLVSALVLAHWSLLHAARSTVRAPQVEFAPATTLGFESLDSRPAAPSPRTNNIHDLFAALDRQYGHNNR